MPDRIIDRDRGMKRIQREVKAFRESAIVFPFPGRKTPREVIQRAALLESGTRNMPARPFLRRALDRNRDKIGRQTEALIGEILDGSKTAKQATDELGQFMADLVAIEIETAREWAAPLADSTVEKKGHDDPLIDTEEMLNSVTFDVRR